ncbi:MAG: LLM class flavin-dependent oxidoreductase [Anaerolineaceae bacterium]|nr:LLM class flavin-dependent oxidoreductase [Anaerolineaceae bacterium]
MIRCGIGINQTPGVGIQQTVEICQDAEQKGFASCWAADQGLDCRDVFVTLTAIVQKTSKIKVGTGITHPYTRHPAVTASAIASIDELSNGRAFLTVSAGGIDTFIPMGLERPKPIAATRELIEICRALFSGKRVSYQGKLFQLNDAYMDSGKADIDIWLAGRGPQMLALGGEIADGVLLDFIHKDFLLDNINMVRKGMDSSGNKPKICYSTMIITNEKVLEEFRPLAFWRLLEPPQNVMDAIGLTQDDINNMRQAFASGGPAAVGKLIKDEWIKPFVIMGSIEECAAELSRIMKKHTFDEFLLPILSVETTPALLSDVARVLALT